MTNLTTKSTKDILQSPAILSKMEKLMGERAQHIITSALQVVNGSKHLANADPMTVLNAVFTAATLNLPIQNNLGFAYIVPYKGQAQFQIGYKGLLQLAMNTGMYERILAIPIYEGQIVSMDKISGFKFNFEVPDEGEPIGYYGFFKLLTGLWTQIYMTYEEMQAHGKRFSKAYTSGPWKTDFDRMACKTVIRLMFSREGYLSTEKHNSLKLALERDQSVMYGEPDNPEIIYIDNDTVKPDVEQERFKTFIETSENYEALSKVGEYYEKFNQDNKDLYDQRSDEFVNALESDQKEQEQVQEGGEK